MIYMGFMFFWVSKFGVERCRLSLGDIGIRLYRLISGGRIIVYIGVIGSR